MVVIGEVGLTGEVRAVSGLPARLREAAALGFAAAIVPQNNLATREVHPLEVQGVGSVEEAVKALLGGRRMTLIIARLGVLAVATGAGVALGPALGLRAASHWLGLAGFLCGVLAVVLEWQGRRVPVDRLFWGAAGGIAGVALGPRRGQRARRGRARGGRAGPRALLAPPGLSRLRGHPRQGR